MITNFKIFENSEPKLHVDLVVKSIMGNGTLRLKDAEINFDLILDNKKIGECRLRRDESRNDTYDNDIMMINKPYQKKGYGERLIRFMIKWLKIDMPHVLYLKINVTSLGALKLYKNVFGELKDLNPNPGVGRPLPDRSPATYNDEGEPSISNRASKQSYLVSIYTKSELTQKRFDL